MQITTNPPPTVWDHFTAQHPASHLLQSAGWATFKANWGWRPTTLLVHDGPRLRAGAQLLVRPLPLRRSIAYLPRGPVAYSNDYEALAILWQAIHHAAQKHGAIFLIVEPNWPAASSAPIPPGLQFHPADLRARGFRPSQFHAQPPTTMALSLCPDPEAILAGMKQKWRYNIRLAERKGITIRTGTAPDFDIYGALMAETGARDNFGVRPAAYYRDAWHAFQPHHSRLLIAEYEGQPVAALLAFRHGHTAWYLYGASSNRERNRMPNHLLQWHAMLWAKSQGAHHYDFWGIPPEIPTDRELTESEEGSGGLWGVYRFKQGFGGEIIRYPGAYEYIYDPLLFWATQQLLARRGGLG